jgi:hypothetical protein
VQDTTGVCSLSHACLGGLSHAALFENAQTDVRRGLTVRLCIIAFPVAPSGTRKHP